MFLTHYNPELPIVITSNSSSYGIGAVIAHDFPDGPKKAVLYTSRSLTPTELLSNAAKSFHKFVYVCHSTHLKDHKPLLSILYPKNIPTYSANRLQR